MKNRQSYALHLPTLILCVFLFITSCTAPDQTTDSGKLLIPGTGACQDLLRQLAKAFNATDPGFEVIIPETTGSNGGIRAVQQNEAVIARVARPLRPEEESSGLLLIPFAKDAVVFAAGARVPKNELTPQQLAAIFSGETVSWQLEDGRSMPIRVIARQEGDSSLTLIRRHLSPFTDLQFGANAKIAAHDPEMVELLNKFTYSIGFLSRSSLLGPDRRFRALSVSGMPLTEEYIRSTAYPMLSEYAFVTRRGCLTPKARRFLDFIQSPAGRALLVAAGMVPVEDQS